MGATRFGEGVPVWRGRKRSRGVGWNQEGGNAMFHVVNAYTRAAQFERLSTEASYRLQKVGGMVLGMVK